MQVLVTGGLGSIGRPVLGELIAKGVRPVVVTRREFETTAVQSRDQVLVRGDIAAPGFLDQVLNQHPVEVIIHLAAALGAPADTPAGFALNAAVPAAVLHAAVSHNVRRVVLASSMSVYGRFAGAHGYPEFRPIGESFPRHPFNLYGLAKLTAEEAGRLYTLRHPLEFVAIRFGPYFGPDRPADGHPGIGTRISTALRQAVAREPIVLPNWPGYQFDPIYVLDCSQAVVRAALSQSLPPREAPWVHVSGGQRTDYDAVGRALQRAVPGCSVRHVEPTSEAELRARESCVVFDNTLARQYLGYSPAYPLERAFEDFVAKLTLEYPTRR